MPKKNLIDKTIISLKANKKRMEYWDKSLKGFGLRISKKGEKSFCIMYRIAGMQRRYTLGSYPKLKLAEARELAKDAFELVRKGKDPVQEKKAEEAKAAKARFEAKTFSQLADQYIQEYAKPNKRSWKEDERIIKKTLLPEFGSLDVQAICRSQIRAFLRKIASKAPVAANRTHACLRMILGWAVKEEIVNLESNPCSGISRPGGKEKPKERVLNDVELKAVWGALEKELPEVKGVMRLILLTGQRPGEVMGALNNEIDLDNALWTIPGSRTKNELSNIVPLSPQAIRVIEKQRSSIEEQKQKRTKRGDVTPESPYLFPNRLISKHAGSPIVHIRKAVGRIHENLGIERFSAHDLRRTLATRLGEMQVPGHVIARLLNHKQMDVTSAVYNKYQYLKEKREALDAWGAKVEVLVSGFELVEAYPAKACISLQKEVSGFDMKIDFIRH